MAKSKADYNTELMDFLFAHFTERLAQTVPSWQIRDGAKHIEIEVLDATAPDPFPCLHILVYPNGKPDKEQQ